FRRPPWSSASGRSGPGSLNPARRTNRPRASWPDPRRSTSQSLCRNPNGSSYCGEHRGGIGPSSMSRRRVAIIVVLALTGSTLIQSDAFLRRLAIQRTDEVVNGCLQLDDPTVDLG